VTEYGPRDLEKNARTVKGCEAGCSILCVYRNSLIDNDRPRAVRTVFRGIREGVLGRGWRPGRATLARPG
jgi:hypothetical protein